MKTLKIRCRGLAVALGFAAFAAVPSVRAEFADTTGMVFRYEMDEVGEDGLVASSGGTYTLPAIAMNGVKTSRGQGKCLEGFTTTQSYLCVTNVSGHYADDWANFDFTFVVWVRTPEHMDHDLSSSLNRLIVRGGGTASNLDGSGANNGWQVWISSAASGNGGALGVSTGHWGGGNVSNLTAEDGVKTALTWKPDTWYQVAVVYSRRGQSKTISAYVTEAGSAEVGEVVASVTMTVDAMWGATKNLMIGAARSGYYNGFFPGGNFNGEMREATLFKRALTKAELLADVKTFSPGVRAVDDFATFHWNLDETGATPVAADATGNGFAGTTAGNVVGGLAAPVGTCYGGFSKVWSDLYTKLDSGNKFSFGRRNEIALWVKRPEAAAGKTALLVGNMVTRDNPGSSQPWRVSVTEDGAVRIAMQDWEGQRTVSVGEPYDWGKGWHLVLVRSEYLKLPVSDSDKTRNSNRIRVYAAPAAKAGKEGDFTLIAEGAFLRDSTAHFPDAAFVVFGAVGSGYYSGEFPQSLLGANGRIGEVAMIADGWFDMDYLKSRLSRYYEPTAGFKIIVR